MCLSWSLSFVITVTDTRNHRAVNKRPDQKYDDLLRSSEQDFSNSCAELVLYESVLWLLYNEEVILVDVDSSTACGCRLDTSITKLVFIFIYIKSVLNMSLLRTTEKLFSINFIVRKLSEFIDHKKNSIICIKSYSMFIMIFNFNALYDMTTSNCNC